MITKIENNQLVVEANGKPAGTYTWKDFTDEELAQERYALVGRLLYTDTSTREKRDEVNNIHTLIGAVNGELETRMLAGMLRRVV